MVPVNEIFSKEYLQKKFNKYIWIVDEIEELGLAIFRRKYGIDGKVNSNILFKIVYVISQYLDENNLMSIFPKIEEDIALALVIYSTTRHKDLPKAKFSSYEDLLKWTKTTIEMAEKEYHKIFGIPENLDALEMICHPINTKGMYKLNDINDISHLILWSSQRLDAADAYKNNVFDFDEKWVYALVQQKNKIVYLLVDKDIQEEEASLFNITEESINKLVKHIVKQKLSDLLVSFFRKNIVPVNSSAERKLIKTAFNILIEQASINSDQDLTEAIITTFDIQPILQLYEREPIIVNEILLVKNKDNFKHLLNMIANNAPPNHIFSYAFCNSISFYEIQDNIDRRLYEMYPATVKMSFLDIKSGIQMMISEAKRAIATLQSFLLSAFQLDDVKSFLNIKNKFVDYISLQAPVVFATLFPLKFYVKYDDNLFSRSVLYYLISQLRETNEPVLVKKAIEKALIINDPLFPDMLIHFYPEKESEIKDELSKLNSYFLDEIKERTSLYLKMIDNKLSDILNNIKKIVKLTSDTKQNIELYKEVMDVVKEKSPTLSEDAAATADKVIYKAITFEKGIYGTHINIMFLINARAFPSSFEKNPYREDSISSYSILNHVEDIDDVMKGIDKLLSIPLRPYYYVLYSLLFKILAATRQDLGDEKFNPYKNIYNKLAKILSDIT